MTTSYHLPNPLPWARIAGPLATAEDAVARLDERLRSSPIRDGWIARTHFMDAAASLALDGSIVSLEDLVLHDARLDIRAPTAELTRARAVLRARRRIATAEPGWALTPAGLDALRGRGPSADDDRDDWSRVASIAMGAARAEEWTARRICTRRTVWRRAMTATIPGPQTSPPSMRRWRGPIAFWLAI